MKTVTIKAESPSYGGRSIGKLNGKVVMIKGAIPGEMCEVKIEEEKKDYDAGVATSILTPSADRCLPECPYFDSCGGCQLQFITYERQVLLKEEILRDCLRRIAKIEIQPSPSIVGSNPWNYRLRGQFKMAAGKTGFYMEKSREIVDIESCPLMSEEVNLYLAKVRTLPGNITAGEMHISVGDGAVALLKASHSAAEDLKKLSHNFMDSGFSGVVIQTPGRKAVRLGKQYITLGLEGLIYTVSPMTFFQSHWSLNRVVVQFLKAALQSGKKQRIMDLCSGAGNFSLPLAADAAEVIAIEESADAVRDGRRNADINEIKNCTFVNSSMDTAMIANDIDILIIDPPRPGLTGRTTDNILAAAPERIAYVSCNPTTLARDLKKLAVRYVIESIRLIDFFPQTYHMESLALLRRQEK